MKHPKWTDSASLGISLQEPASTLLGRYVELLLDRALPARMISAVDRDRLAERHILDCLRGAPLLPEAASVLDLGSGAGLPGIPIALARPDVSMTLGESRRSRAAFLELVVDNLALTNVRVAFGRVEDLTGRFDAIVARAFGSTSRSWDVAERLLLEGGILLYWAGTSSPTEVPTGARSLGVATSALANAGPIVIMARQ